jgi:hypothetical protein
VAWMMQFKEISYEQKLCSSGNNPNKIMHLGSEEVAAKYKREGLDIP